MPKLIKWFKNKLQSVLITISLGLIRTENELLKSNYRNLGSKTEQNRRWYSNFSFLQNFAQGQRDEKYVKDFYEILKKTESYLQNADEHTMRVSADKHSKSFGRPDEDGNSHTFFGYFDPKHKYAGKTFKEVESLLLLEKKAIKDDYELAYVVNNKPIENIDSIINKESELLTRDELYKLKLQLQFPIKIYRDNDKNINKIEKLTEVLQIKHIGLDLYRLEFIIPIKFKTNTVDEDSDIFKELIDINEIYFKDTFGELIGFKIKNYKERVMIKKKGVKDDKEIDFYEALVFMGNKINVIK
ncbi:MAG: hypothetical protein ACOCVF_00345 [bacterium]